MGLLTAIGIGIAASTALGSIGQVKAGNAAKRAGELNAEREEFNAGIADLQAADATQRGQDEANLIRSGVRSLIGAQRAGFAGQGVVIGEGSARDVQADTAYLGERDAQQRLNNAALEAWGYRVEAYDRRMAAQISRQTGQAAASAGRWGAATTAIGGATNVMLLNKYGWGPRTTAPTGV